MLSGLRTTDNRPSFSAPQRTFIRDRALLRNHCNNTVLQLICKVIYVHTNVHFLVCILERNHDMSNMTITEGSLPASFHKGGVKAQRLRKSILAANGRGGMRSKASQFTRKCWEIMERVAGVMQKVLPSYSGARAFSSISFLPKRVQRLSFFPGLSQPCSFRPSLILSLSLSLSPFPLLTFIEHLLCFRHIDMHSLTSSSR